MGSDGKNANRRSVEYSIGFNDLGIGQFFAISERADGLMDGTRTLMSRGRRNSVFIAACLKVPVRSESE
jgi:hypothetical protein